MAINGNVLAWLAGHDTGRSSLAIVAWMEHDPALTAMHGGRLDYPHDPADLGRCLRLLDIEPDYRARIGEMASVSPQWARLVCRWNELEALYHEAEPNGRARKCYELIQELIKPDVISQSS